MTIHAFILKSQTYGLNNIRGRPPKYKNKFQ